MKLRRLRMEDMPDLMALKAAAGWNQTEEDWLRMLRLAPDGCFGIEADGRVVASATTVCYGNDLAWIGMVLTLPEYRGKGLARQLMGAALDASGTRVVRLDASDQGKPLYKQLGFLDECPIERWIRQPAPYSTDLIAQPLRSIPMLDREVFGADRSSLLNDLPAGAAFGAAYAFHRPGSLADYFGPCVASEHADGVRSLRWWVGQFGASRPLALDLFPHQKSTVEAVAGLGFTPFRRLTRMVRQPASPELPDHRTFAIAGFEWG